MQLRHVLPAGVLRRGHDALTVRQLRDVVQVLRLLAAPAQILLVQFLLFDQNIYVALVPLELHLRVGVLSHIVGVKVKVDALVPLSIAGLVDLGKVVGIRLVLLHEQRSVAHMSEENTLIHNARHDRREFPVGQRRASKVRVDQRVLHVDMRRFDVVLVVVILHAHAYLVQVGIDYRRVLAPRLVLEDLHDDETETNGAVQGVLHERVPVFVEGVLDVHGRLKVLLVPLESDAVFQQLVQDHAPAHVEQVVALVVAPERAGDAHVDRDLHFLERDIL